MNKQIGVFIPARLSSERLPYKLILPIGDTCLFEIACRKLNDLPDNINKYALVCDDELIRIAEKYPNIKVVYRSPMSAKAEGPLSFIFKEMRFVQDTHLLFLNPCLAFLSTDTILSSIKRFEDSDADYGTSVKTLQNWIMTTDGDLLNYMDYQRLTTKEIDPLYQAAHCFHVFNKEKFFEDGYMLKEGFLPLPIPHEETLDVDTREDYNYVKWKYEEMIKCS